MGEVVWLAAHLVDFHKLEEKERRSYLRKWQNVQKNL
jgi:hypothetical protein